MREVTRSIVISGIATFIVLSLAGSLGLVRAAMMSSSSYKIQDDSLNFGGGTSSSTTYKSESTFGEVATGDSSSANYKIHAGYQQMNSVYLAMTSAAGVTMSPSLGGITGGTSNGSTNTTVTTDDPAGYSLYVKASSSPAMKGNSNGDSIADYTPSFPLFPDYNFTVAANAAQFGFTPEGNDIYANFLDSDGVCGFGIDPPVDTPDICWAGLSTTDRLIATRSSANTPSGTATTIKFRITIGSSSFKLEGTYTATTTLTALAQ